MEFLELLWEERKSPRRKDLHHLLKARTMEFRIPIQLILPSTYDESLFETTKLVTFKLKIYFA